VETQQNYGVICNALINTKLTHAQKSGYAVGFGIGDVDNSIITYETLNGRKFAAGDSAYCVAGPLNSILSNAEQLIPLHSMGAVRLQLTTDTIANMFHSAVAAPTTVTLSNIEICFDIVDIVGSEHAVMSMVDGNGNIQIKSQSYITSTQSIASGLTGSLELVYNQRISSIKTLMAIFGRASSNRLILPIMGAIIHS
jgi:hypothetical protein